MTKKINIGIIGCADIAERSVIPAIKELDELFNLKGVASRNEEKARHFAMKFNTAAFVGYDTLIAEDGLDAVYVPLPNALHFEWIQKSLDRNLHVLAEKSLACSLSEVEHLTRLAKQKKLTLVENFQFRFHHQLQVIKNIIKENGIGELRCMRSSFGFPPFKDPQNIRYHKELGGGALMDAGAYPVKISQVFLGNDLTVEAANLRMDETNGIDLWGGAYLKQNNGNMFAEIAFGFDNYYQCNMELWGSKGKLYTNRIFTAPKNHKPEIILESETGKQIISLEEDHHFVNMLKYFHSIIVTGEGMDDEYNQNVNQARLLGELRMKASV
jgi:NDP-hexose-3-ketoreductase